MTNDSPYFQTWMVGLFVKLGLVLKDASLGIFLYVIVQMAFFALVIAYMLKFFEKRGVDKKVGSLVWFFYSLFPLVPLYIIAIGKDINFGIVILLLSVFLLEIIDDAASFLENKQKVFALGIALLLICLLRNAGFFLLVGCLPVLWIIAKGYRKTICLIASVVIFFMLVWSNVLLPSLGIREESLSANISIPLLQTARYVKYYGAEVTKNEQEAINKVVEYDALADEYNPEMSDSIKALFNNNATKDQIKGYIGVYIKQFFKHPVCYIDALINKSYGYFCPDDKGREKRYVFIGLDNIDKLNEKSGFDIKAKFPNAVLLITFIMDFFFREIPFVGMFTSIGFYTWNLIVAFALAAENKNKMRLFAFVPSVLVLIGCIASPVNAYFRYGIPIVFCAPFLWMVVIYNQKSGERRQ